LAENGAIKDIDNVYVILLSDGKPTWRTDETSTTEVDAVGEANNTGTWDALKDIVKDGSENDIAIAEDIKEMAELYAILYSNDLESKFSVGADHPLTGVSGAEWITNSGDYYVGADAVFDSPAADGLDTAFLEINDRIDVIAKAWTVSDELSDEVTFGEFTLNGNYACVNGSSVSWALGNMEPESGDGSMADPYIYTMKYTVQLESARDNVKAASLAHDADPSLEGIWTGENAELQYLMVEKEVLDDLTSDEIDGLLRRVAFDKVSVKGIYGGLTFVKKDGETGEVMSGVGFTLYDSEGKAYGEEVFSDETGTVVFNDIPRGTYTLKETAVPEGMQQMTDLALEEAWGAMKCADGSDMPEVINNWKIGMEAPNPDPKPDPDPKPNPDPKPDPDPDSTPDVPFDEPEVPLGPAPEAPVVPAPDTEEIFDEDVPLADAPKTGDTITLWLALSALSGTGLASVSFLDHKKRKEEE